MKITKQQLKQLIKEEILKETDWYDLEKDELPSHVKKPPGRSGADVEAERALLSAIDSLAALDYSREDIMDLVTDLVDTSSQGKPEDPDAEWMDDRHREDQEDWPEDKDEEALHLSAPKEKPKYNWHTSRYRGKKK